MTLPALVPDFMGDLRDWLRALPDLTGTTGPRVFFSVPAGAAFPLIRLTEAGGGMQPGETPVGDRRVLIEVIGGAPADYYKVSAATRTVETALHLLAGDIGTTTHVYDAHVDTVTDAPDPADGAPRKVISAVLTIRAQ